MGTIYPWCVFKIGIGDHYDPICHFTFMLGRCIKIFYVRWSLCDFQDRLRRPISRITSTERLIRLSGSNWVHRDSYRYIGTSRRVYFIIYPDGDMTWLGRLTVSPRRDTDNHVFEVTSYRPRRNILLFCRPIVTIGVLQIPHIHTIGSIQNLYHPLSWRWCDLQCQSFSYDLSYQRGEI